MSNDPMTYLKTFSPKPEAAHRCDLQMAWTTFFVWLVMIIVIPVLVDPIGWPDITHIAVFVAFIVVQLLGMNAGAAMEKSANLQRMMACNRVEIDKLHLELLLMRYGITMAEKKKEPSKHPN